MWPWRPPRFVRRNCDRCFPKFVTAETTSRCNIGNVVVHSDLLAELNVVKQVLHVCQTTAVADAWQRGQDLTIHGCLYGLHDGRLHDLA